MAFRLAATLCAALIGVSVSTLQSFDAIAQWGDCRATPLRAPEGAAVTGAPFTLERDVDGDGVADVVELRASVGSQAAAAWGTLRLSASGEEIEISRNVSFSRMINITVVPPALVSDDRAAARRLVEDALFGIICRRPDPSLSWFLDINDPIVWRPGKPAPPPGNYAIYFPEAPLGLIPFIGAWSELGFGGDKPVAVWIDYLGGTHTSSGNSEKNNIEGLENGFEVLAATPRYRILGTRHGVVAIDIAAERYAWLYVYNGGHKLRWKSIKGATIDGDAVIITAFDRNPGAEEIGTITVHLDDGGYEESWVPRTADAESRQAIPE